MKSISVPDPVEIPVEFYEQKQLEIKCPKCTFDFIPIPSTSQRKWTVRRVILEALEANPNIMRDFSTMRLADKTLDRVVDQAESTTITLEDAEYELVRDSVENHEWPSQLFRYLRVFLFAVDDATEFTNNSGPVLEETPPTPMSKG